MALPFFMSSFTDFSYILYMRSLFMKTCGKNLKYWVTKQQHIMHVGTNPCWAHTTMTCELLTCAYVADLVIMGYITVILLRNKTIFFFKKMSGYGIRWVTHSFKCSMGDRLSSTRLPIFQEFISLTLKT